MKKTFKKLNLAKETLYELDTLGRTTAMTEFGDSPRSGLTLSTNTTSTSTKPGSRATPCWLCVTSVAG